MEDADGGFQAWVVQVFIEGRQIFRHDQAFIGDHFAGERCHVKVFVAAQRLLGVAATHEKIDIEIVAAAGGNEQLLDTRQAVQRHGAADTRVRGHYAPAQHVQTACT